MLVIIWPPVTEGRWPGPRPEQQFDAVGLIYILIFVSASHQTGLDTRSMTRRSIIVEIRGEESRAQAEARALLDYAGHQST